MIEDDPAPDSEQVGHLIGQGARPMEPAAPSSPAWKRRCEEFEDLACFPRSTIAPLVKTAERSASKAEDFSVPRDDTCAKRRLGKAF
jgi:hypothetical protein